MADIIPFRSRRPPPESKPEARVTALLMELISVLQERGSLPPGPIIDGRIVH